MLRFVTLCIAKNRFTESGLDRIVMQNELHIYKNPHKLRRMRFISVKITSPASQISLFERIRYKKWRKTADSFLNTHNPVTYKNLSHHLVIVCNQLCSLSKLGRGFTLDRDDIQNLQVTECISSWELHRVTIN